MFVIGGVKNGVSTSPNDFQKLIFNVEAFGYNQGLVPEIEGNYQSTSLISAHFLLKNA